MDAHPVAERGLAEPPGEAAGVDQRAARVMPEPSEVRRRVHLGPHRVAVEQGRLLAVLPRGLGGLRQPLDLVRAGGHVDHARLLPGGVDPARGERLAHGGEVLRAQALEDVDLVGPAGQAVLEPVGERRLREAPVPPARAPAAAVTLEQDNVLVGRGKQGAPEAGEATAHDRELAGRLTLQRRERLRRGWRVQPVDPLLGVRERAAGSERGAQPRSQPSTSAAALIPAPPHPRRGGPAGRSDRRRARSGRRRSRG